MTKTLQAEDFMDEAESAERAEAWPQAAALWGRAAELCSGSQEQRCRDGISRCQEAIRVDTEMASIARRIMDIPTLETRKSDSLDFHEVAVWEVLSALRLAYRTGQRDGKR
jgi:hypothetical protein